MPTPGTGRRSEALGANDPRGRRDAQARGVESIQFKDPLYVDNDGKLTADTAAFRALPGMKRRAVDASYAMVKGDELIGVTSTSAARTITLPPASQMKERAVTIKDESGACNINNITVDGYGSETIEGSATLVMSTAYQTARLYSTGMAWFTC